MKRFQLLVLGACCALLGACSGSQNKAENSSSEKPTVTVSILPLKYFVEQIAGETVQVKVLVPPGSSPELFEPQPSIMVDFSKSDLYFASGLIDFEKGLEVKLTNGPTKYINLSINANIIEGSCNHESEEHEHHHHHGADPHIWMSCKEVKQIATIIATELCYSYTQNAELYRSNLEKFTEFVNVLDYKISNIIEKSSCKQFLIYHPSLGYFARDYGLNQISIEIEGKDPTAKGLNNTIRAAKDSGITSILAQSQFDTKNALAIAAELNGNVIEIDPLAENWPAQMELIANAIANK